MKEIKSKIVKESMIDYDNLAKTLKENTSSAVKDLLSETVRETYERILSEEDENEYEEEEVKDTDAETVDDADETAADTEVEEPTEEDAEEKEDADEDGEEFEAEDETKAEEEAPSEDGVEDEGWAEFDKYKVSDGEYDFSNAEDEEIVKVYKLMKDTDEVVVNVDNDTNKVELKDNSTGAEYLLDLGSNDEPSDIDAEGDLEIDNEMDESTIFEIALNEYDSHVGYTDNYQSKDVITNPGMSEPGKNVNDWDAGVPKDSKKPWAKKGSDKPFTEKGATTVECGLPEGEQVTEEEEPIEETTTVTQNGPLNRGAEKIHRPDTSRKKVGRNVSTAPDGQLKGTGEAAYQGVSESKNMLSKVNKILRENKELKVALNKFKDVLKEAAVTNMNLGQIIKLISENSTTRDEKQEIIARFGKEATTIEESKKLYASINNELKKKNTLNINEEKQFTAEGSKEINETKIYQSKDLMNTLDLMHRICL